MMHTFIVLSFNILTMLCPSASFLLDGPRSPLKVAAFNIKAFGQAKMLDNAVANNIVKILHRSDLVLIQEVRDSSGSALRNLQTLLNTKGKWSYVASSRIGRTFYKEQYVFFYRNNTLEVTGQYLYRDSAKDYFEREPFSIEVNYYSISKSAFRRVVFLGLHTQPENTPDELIRLPQVIKAVKTRFGKSDGVVAMGDFNADCGYLNGTMRGRLEIFTASSGFKSYIADVVDTTVSPSTNCAYDRVVSLGTVDVRGAQPFNFQNSLKLSLAEANNVSDHYPVEFQLY